MAELGAVNVRIGADTTSLNRGVNDAQSQLKKFGGEVRKGASTLAKYGAAATAAGVAVTAALVKKGLDAVDAQAKLAGTLQTTSASMATLKRASQLSGISMGEASASAQRLTRRLSLAAGGTGPASEAIKKFGFNIEELMAMPLDERIASVNKRIREFVPAAQQAGVASQFFGDEGGLVMQRLNPDVIAQAAKEARLFGTSISEVDAAQVEAANDAMSTISTAIGGVSKQLAVQLAPIIQGVSQMFVQTAEDVGGIENAVQEAVGPVQNAIGFMADAVDGVKRVFSIAADEIVIAFAGMASGISGYIASLIEDADAVASALGSDMFKPAAEALRGFSDQNRAVMSEASANIRETLAEPMPSTMMDAFIADVREKSEEAANVMVESRKKMEAALAGGEGGQPAMSEEEKEKQQQELDALQAKFDQEFAIEQEHMQRMKELRMLNKEGRFASEQEFNEAMKEEQRRMNEQMLALEKEKYSSLEGLARKHWGAEQSIAVGALQGIASTMSGENKKMFEANKAFGIADALISTYQGIAGALKLPFPANIAAAAQTAAVGFKQVSAIKSQSFGGGGGGGGSSAGAVGGGASAAGGGGGQAQQPARQVADVTFNVSGGGMMRDLAKQLVEPMNDLRRDGYEIGSVGVA